MRWVYLVHVRQTLVQLSEELVDTLDRRARAEGVSRSRLIRDLLSAGLSTAEEHDRALIAGYTASPQSDAADTWGDLDAWAQLNARRNLAALTDGGW